MSNKNKEKKDKKKPGDDPASLSKISDELIAESISDIKQAEVFEPAEKPILVDKKAYAKELRRLQIELVKLQEWVRFKNLKVVGLHIPFAQHDPL